MKKSLPLIAFILCVLSLAIVWSIRKAHAQNSTRWEPSSGFGAGGAPFGQNTLRFYGEVVIIGPNPTFDSRYFGTPEPGWVAKSVGGTAYTVPVNDSGYNSGCFIGDQAFPFDNQSFATGSLQMITNTETVVTVPIIASRLQMGIIPIQETFPSGLDVSSGVSMQVYEDGCKPVNIKLYLLFTR